MNPLVNNIIVVKVLIKFCFLLISGLDNNLKLRSFGKTTLSYSILLLELLLKLNSFSTGLITQVVVS